MELKGVRQGFGLTLQNGLSQIGKNVSIAKYMM